MQHDFCDSDTPTTLWPSIAVTFEPIQQLCTEARARRLPVFYTQGLVAGDGSSAWLVALGEMMDHDAQAICGPRGHDRRAHRWRKTKGKIGLQAGSK